MQVRAAMLKAFRGYIGGSAVEVDAAQTIVRWGSIIRNKFNADNLHLTAKHSHEGMDQV
jgi:hypothetical protein